MDLLQKIKVDGENSQRQRVEEIQKNPFMRNYTVSPPYTISFHRRMDKCSKVGKATTTEEKGGWRFEKEYEKTKNLSNGGWCGIEK